MGPDRTERVPSPGEGARTTEDARTEVARRKRDQAGMPAASSTCARSTWVGLHTVGLGLLWLCGGWSPLPLSSPLNATMDAILLSTLIFYAAASLVNPGYVEQQPLPEGQHALPVGQPPPAASPLLALPQCVHCRALQVARAKHCHDCGRCVQRLDHHCWWLGTCVGSGNHRLFVGYLTLQALLLIATGAAAARGISLSDSQRAASAPWPSVALGSALACVSMCSVLGLLALTLLIFQCSLIGRGETTWEHLRRERINASMQLPPDVRPYDAGTLRNWLSFLKGGTQRRVATVAAAATRPLRDEPACEPSCEPASQGNGKAGGPPYGL